ncbi:MAG TPA: 7-cyano-7-deazaguanine synthase QueC [Gemmatimonadaceae bacterium]|nr:7-cyano-7-deazaguanine synthase QueC [Gemmatimonadaceae bacterium]
MEPKKAVLLLSGGLDSTTLLALAKSEGYAVHALSFRYGQRHSAELQAAQKIAELFGVVQHIIIDIDPGVFAGSALTSNVEVPKDRPLDSSPGIPVTYVPARNTIFLAFALAWAEVLEADDIHIGVNALDYSGYPDCRPEFIDSFERMARLATRAGVEGNGHISIRTPLIDMTKREIIELGLRLGVDYSMTTSCYDPASDGSACGHCDACQLRLRGFAEAGAVDPGKYVLTPSHSSEVEARPQ